MLTRFCLYGFLKNQRYFEPFFMLALLAHELSFFWIGMLYACRSLTLNLLEIPSGAIADSWGRRGCMVFSFSAYILSFLTFAYAPHPALLFPAMVLFGIGDSFRTGTHKSMIFEWLRIQGRESERTRVYGVTRSWSKFGSAVSALLATAFILVTGDFRSVFLFATIPCFANIVNFLGYPKNLDGKGHNIESRRRLSIRQVLRRGLDTVTTTWRSLSLRRLAFESMAWEGVLHAVKDYLQPVLTALVLGLALTQATDSIALTGDHGMANAHPSSVIVIGLTYFFLFLFSGWASRRSHRFVSVAGSESGAVGRLWRWNLFLYATLGLFDFLNVIPVVAVAFVLLIVLQNVWRPILVSRFDQHADAGQGATVMSIESQSQRLATLVVAPLMGLAIDLVAQTGTPGNFWPIGIVGGLASLLMLLTHHRMR